MRSQYIGRGGQSQGIWPSCCVCYPCSGRRAMSNMLKTGMLLGVLTALFVVIGYGLGGQQGMVVAFGLAFLMNVLSYWVSDKIVLAMYGAKPISEAEAPNRKSTRLNSSHRTISYAVFC